MRKIIAAEFVTLDGVMEAPGSGDTTLPDRRGWTEPYMSAEIGERIGSQMAASDAMLLGRVTYQGFAAYWSAQPADDPFAQQMNNTTKYVVSTTLNQATWKNSTLINRNVAEELTRLKQGAGKDISIVGSARLVQSLTKLALIDEYQLLVFPVILGVGKRLFDNISDMKKLKLVESKAFDTGVLLLRYQLNQG
jgi:dihydrofolate reductase